MTPYGLARIWPHVPLAQRRRLIAQLSQMATRYLETIWQAEEPPDEPNDTCQCLRAFRLPALGRRGELSACGGG